MNTRLASAYIFAAALSVSALCSLSAASKNDTPVAFPVRTLTASKEGGEQIERGTTRSDVSWAMRYKSRQELSPDVWVFSGYHVDADLANASDCGTLVITFVHDKVADMKLVNESAATIIAANLKLSPSVRNVASNK